MHSLSKWEVSLALFVLCLAVAIVAPAQTFNTLVNFSSSADGNPNSPFVQGIDGNLYVGTGVIYRMTPEGALSVINHGAGSGMVLELNGNLYGSISGGGSSGCGIVFGLTSAETRFILHTFNGTDGCTPWGGVTLGPDGNFYGTTGGDGSGASGFGNVFKVTYNGTFTVLHTFSGTDGTAPTSPLVLGNNGNLYGTTIRGGTSGNGTVFMIAPNGTFTNLHNFDGVTDGGGPSGAMVQGPDGNLYGTTLSSVFMISPGGHTFKTLYSFTIDGANGSAPNGPLVVGTDGNFYGTTFAGGASDSGVIFEITPRGVLTVLHSFGAKEGGTYPTLMQHTNGTFYGTTFADGTSAEGTLFSLSTGLGPFISTVPPMRGIGSRVLILGQDLTGATSVTFNGVAAAFTVNSDTEITAIVPVGATKGFVRVTTASGTLSTKVVFVVD
jgi:uncharacterized repeat protein (TIGR03803 family)